MPANAQVDDPQNQPGANDQLEAPEPEYTGPTILNANQVARAIEHGETNRDDAQWIKRYQEAVSSERTGHWDEGTVQRIARFQKNVMKAKPTGKVGPKTHKKLRARLQKRHGLDVLTDDERDDARDYNASDKIDKGDIGRFKKVLGVKKGGRNNEDFLNSVGRFQRRNGLDATGQLTRQTRRKLSRQLKRLRAAVKHNRKAIKDKRWIRRYQEAIEARRTGKWDLDTVRRISEFQQTVIKKAPSGKLGKKTRQRLRLHLRRKHGWKKGLLLTNAERSDARKYNNKLGTKKKWIRKFKKILKVKKGGRGSRKFIESVARFQRRHKATPTGKLTKGTRNKLRKAIKRNESSGAGGVRGRILQIAEASLTSRTGHNYYSQPGALTTNPTAKYPNRSDCSQWVRACYLRAGAGDPGTYTGAMQGLGHRTSNPTPGDLVLGPGHVELYVGNGKTIGHGSPPINYGTTSYWLGRGFWFHTYNFLK